MEERTGRQPPGGRASFFPWLGGHDLGIGETGASGVLYPQKESGNVVVAPIGTMGGLPGGGVGLGKCFRVA